MTAISARNLLKCRAWQCPPLKRSAQAGFGDIRHLANGNIKAIFSVTLMFFFNFLIPEMVNFRYAPFCPSDGWWGIDGTSSMISMELHCVIGATRAFSKSVSASPFQRSLAVTSKLIFSTLFTSFATLCLPSQNNDENQKPWILSPLLPF